MLKKNIFGWGWKIFTFFLDQKKFKKYFFISSKKWWKIMIFDDFWWFSLIFHHFLKNILWTFFWSRKKMKNFQLHPKIYFLSNIISMKYSDLNFYWNRVSRTWFARAIRSPGFWSKMSPGMSCSNGGDHMHFSEKKMGILCSFVYTQFWKVDNYTHWRKLLN